MAQEERFTRKKHDANFPINAIKFCLLKSRVKASDLDLIVYYDKPLSKFSRLLKTYFAFAPKASFLFKEQYPVGLIKDFLRKTDN